MTDNDDVTLPSVVDSIEDPSLPSDCESNNTDDIAEFYSPPRVVPVANRLGLKGLLSLDIETDFMKKSARAESWSCSKSAR